MKNRLNYETPEAELFVIRFEEGFLQDSPFNRDGNRKLIIDEEDEDFM